MKIFSRKKEQITDSIAYEEMICLPRNDFQSALSVRLEQDVSKLISEMIEHEKKYRTVFTGIINSVARSRAKGEEVSISDYLHMLKFWDTPKNEISKLLKQSQSVLSVTGEDISLHYIYSKSAADWALKLKGFPPPYPDCTLEEMFDIIKS
jgi:hypothetical protein